ncbi:hypothetical protein C8Q75DRAFT_574232 [Abortiporus biennis]|nr:hypothetical protein C8Q75DRAFT_574232 [Abortiporus biennis]
MRNTTTSLVIILAYLAPSMLAIPTAPEPAYLLGKRYLVNTPKRDLAGDTAQAQRVYPRQQPISFPQYLAERQFVAEHPRRYTDNGGFDFLSDVSNVESPSSSTSAKPSTTSASSSPYTSSYRSYGSENSNDQASTSDTNAQTKGTSGEDSKSKDAHAKDLNKKKSSASKGKGEGQTKLKLDDKGKDHEHEDEKKKKKTQMEHNA